MCYPSCRQKQKRKKHKDTSFMPETIPFSEFSSMKYFCPASDEGSHPEIVCPSCGNRQMISPLGSYVRRQVSGSDLTKIMRYRCLDPTCPRKTFSALRHPFLPVLRHKLCTLRKIAELSQKYSKAAISKASGLTWGVVKRAISRGRQILEWMKNEASAAAWGASPCLSPANMWGSFTRSLSVFLFPERT